MPKSQDHPYATIFPLMDDADLAALAESIAIKGQLDPVWTLNGQTLDGRNRRRACELKGIECRTEEYTGDDPLGFVIAKNLDRRHLTTSQRAMVAAFVASTKDEGESANLQNGRTTQADAAKLLNVSPRTVSDAAKVLKNGTPELQDAVRKGEASVSAAAAVADLPPAEQRRAVKDDAVADTAREVKDRILCQRCKEGIPMRDCRWCAEEAANRDAARRAKEKGGRDAPLVGAVESEDAELLTEAEKGGGHPFAALKTDLARLSAAFTRAIKDHGEDSLRLKEMLTWIGFIDHIPASIKTDATGEIHDKSGGVAFIAFKGLAKVLEMAGAGGKMPKKETVLNQFAYASGAKTWIPGMTLRNRGKKVK